MRIPILNKPLIHLFDRLERASGIADDVGMKKVGIRYKPFIHLYLEHWLNGQQFLHNAFKAKPFQFSGWILRF